MQVAFSDADALFQPVENLRGRFLPGWFVEQFVKMVRKKMERFIVKIRVSKSGKPDTFMIANRNVAAISMKNVIIRLTDELDEMEPVEEDPDDES